MSGYTSNPPYTIGQVVVTSNAWDNPARVTGVQYSAKGNVSGYKIRFTWPPYTEKLVTPEQVLGEYQDLRVCTCGAASVKSPYHATYCDAYDRRVDET